MDEFLVAKISPGSVRDEIAFEEPRAPVPPLDGHRRPHGISVLRPGFRGSFRTSEIQYTENVTPPLQPVNQVFFDECDAKVKEEVDDYGRQDSRAVETIVKEEPLGEDFGDNEDIGIQGGEKSSEEARQDLSLALQGDVPPDDFASFECDICNFVCNQKRLLLRHWKTHPKCEDCGLRFLVKKLLTEHRNHFHDRNSATFDCDICGNRLSNKNNLERHKMVHTGERPFECEVCLERFTRKYNLKMHMRVHTGEKPLECEVCLKRFSQRSCLTVHMRTHTGEKPYECGVCLRGFIDRRTLARHRIIHTGEKPFECTECLRRFADNSTLRVHSRRTHGFQKMLN